MAFTILTKDKKEFSWYINSKERKPKFEVADPAQSIVIMLQASGEELRAIEIHFKNIPITGSICTWRGEMAQFIYDNL